MKLEAKQRLLAYEADEEPAKYLEPAPFTLAKHCTLVENAGSGVEVYYAKGSTQGDQFFYFVKNGMLHGQASLEAPLWVTRLPFETTRRPHVSFTKEFSGMGVATAFYSIILNRGISLATLSHSASAKKLWDRLANMSGVNSYWFDIRGKQLRKNTSTALRVLTKETL